MNSQLKVWLNNLKISPQTKIPAVFKNAEQKSDKIVKITIEEFIELLFLKNQLNKLLIILLP